MIRAIIHTGEFRDAAAEKAVADIMIKRRDKILKAYLPAVNPIVSARMDGQGRFDFDNAAVSADVAKRPDSYRAAWFEFDNATGDARPLGEISSPTTLVEAPDGLPTANGSYVGVDISADGTAYELVAPACPRLFPTRGRRLEVGRGRAHAGTNASPFEKSRELMWSDTIAAVRASA